MISLEDQPVVRQKNIDLHILAIFPTFLTSIEVFFFLSFFLPLFCLLAIKDPNIGHKSFCHWECEWSFKTCDWCDSWSPRSSSYSLDVSDAIKEYLQSQHFFPKRLETWFIHCEGILRNTEVLKILFFSVQKHEQIEQRSCLDTTLLDPMTALMLQGKNFSFWLQSVYKTFPGFI